MRSTHRTLLHAILALAACGAPAAYAQDRIVDTNADGASDGECVTDCTLREAAILVGAGGTITFDAGLSGQTITLNQGQITLTKNMTIDGASLAVTAPSPET